LLSIFCLKFPQILSNTTVFCFFPCALRRLTSKDIAFVLQTRLAI
jgi:hypothetical protein